MGPLNIESSELKYYSSVNKLIFQEVLYNVYENLLVPEMYDHNFIYVHKPLDKTQFKGIYNLYKHRWPYVNFFFAVNLLVPEEVYENVLRDEDYEDETIVFMKLAKYPDEWKLYPDIEVVKVTTDKLLDEFLLLNYVEDVEVSKRFAKDKQRLNQHLYDFDLCDFYIAYYKGIPAASGELYNFNGTGKLENLFCTESLQHNGIATELMRKMVDHSKQSGLEEFYLATYEYDDPIKLYEKLGFIEVGKQKNITIFF